MNAQNHPHDPERGLLKTLGIVLNCLANAQVDDQVGFSDDLGNHFTITKDK